MSRQSVRNAMSTMLAGLTVGSAPLFAAVYPVLPGDVSQEQTPAAFVMIQKQKDARRGPGRRMQNYTVQIRLWYINASQGSTWNTSNPNLWVPPGNDPQVMFDNWLDEVIVALRTNNSFSIDSPGGNTVAILQGEPEFNITLAEPERDSNYIVMCGVIETPVIEQTLGV